MSTSDLPTPDDGRAASLPDPNGRVRTAAAAPDSNGGQAPSISWGSQGKNGRTRLGKGRWRRWVGRRLGIGARSPSTEPDAEGGDEATGLHAVTRGSDVWFAIETAQLEKEAVELAASAAAANLPRTDVVYAEVEEEAALAGRCRAVLHGWADRVRTKVQDAVQESVQAAGARTEAYEHEIGALSGTLTELRQGRAELRSAETAAEAGQAHLEVRRFLSAGMYVFLIGLLVLVDWIANVPVFTELLPKDPGADAAWRELAARSETMGLWGGPYRIWARAVHNIDASLLALGVIVFLVYLAHVLGESLRRLVSHSAAEAPAAALTIRTHRRQFVVPAVLGLLGVVTVVSVLWLARDRVEATTAQRVAEAEARIETTVAELEAARAEGDLLAVGRLEQEAAGLRILREQRVERADYAIVISRMNLPILLLNIVLALAAAVAGYLMTRDAVRGALMSPHAAELRRHLHELRAQSVRRRDAIVAMNTDIDRELARAEYLLASRPLRGWEARAERLRSVIPRFRSENARRRGIDTANIAAFTRPPALDLSLDEERADTDALARSAELRAHRERHQRLRGRAAEVLARMQNETPYATDTAPDTAPDTGDAR